MVKACSAPGCRYQYFTGDGIKMHSFPSNEELKMVWLQSMKKENVPNFPSKTSAICSQHFETNCYEKRNNTLSLKKNAVPSIFYESKSIRPVVHNINLGNVVYTEYDQEIEIISDPVEARLRQIFDEVETDEQNQNKNPENESIIIQVLAENKEDENMSEIDATNSLPSLQIQIVDESQMNTEKNSIGDEDLITQELVDNEQNIEYVECSECDGNMSQTIDDGDMVYMDDTESAKPIQVTRNRKQPHFLGDFIYEDLEDSVQRRKYWLMSHKVCEVYKRKLRYCSGRIRALDKRVQVLTEEVMRLKADKGELNNDKASKKLVYVAQKRDDKMFH